MQGFLPLPWLRPLRNSLKMNNSLIVKSLVPFDESDSPSGKFVLLLNGPVLHIIFSSLEFTPYHADIVREYLCAFDPSLVSVVAEGMCHINGQNWKIQGGGTFECRPEDKQLLLRGKSTAFGRYNKELLIGNEIELLKQLSLNRYTLALR